MIQEPVSVGMGWGAQVFVYCPLETLCFGDDGTGTPLRMFGYESPCPAIDLVLCLVRVYPS